jgi:hypothetical protein
LFEILGFNPSPGQKTNNPPTLLLVARRAAAIIGRLTACNLTAFEGGNLEGTPSKNCKSSREENKKLSYRKIGKVK